MDRFTALQQKIEAKTAKVGVIGLGYVGLPLAIEMARNGFTVFGIDLDLKKIETLQRGSPTYAMCQMILSTNWSRKENSSPRPIIGY